MRVKRTVAFVAAAVTHKMQPAVAVAGDHLITHPPSTCAGFEAIVSTHFHLVLQSRAYELYLRGGEILSSQVLSLPHSMVPT